MSAIPLKFGSKEQFARVRQLFIDHKFNDDEVGARHDRGNSPFKSYGRPNVIPEDADGQELLIGLFLKRASTTLGHLRAKLGDSVDDLLSLGMIESTDADTAQATVRIRPMFELYIASDRWAPDDERDKPFEDDVVFPPDTKNALTYLPFLPMYPCERYLEVCGGSGAAALIAAKNFAKHAWTLDITERSTVFADFSGKLNAVDNYTAAQGDLYAPAGDLVFDRIAAHPPFVPVLDQTWIFHAGGNDGEQITRRLVQELPDRLAPGGRFYCRCLGSDREEGPMEMRVRGWLGEQHKEFDIAMVVIQSIEPSAYVTTSLLRKQSGPGDLPRWRQVFSEARIGRFIASMIVIQRRDENRPVFTARRDHGPFSGPRELEWLIQWETMRCTGKAGELILANKLRAGSTELRITHTPHSGDWNLKTQELLTKHPYFCTWEVEPWAAYLLPRPDGKMTGMELYREMVTQGAVDADTTPQDFAGALAELVSAGFLVTEGHLPPEPKKNPWND